MIFKIVMGDKNWILYKYDYNNMIIIQYDNLKLIDEENHTFCIKLNIDYETKHSFQKYLTMYLLVYEELHALQCIQQIIKI